MNASNTLIGNHVDGVLRGSGLLFWSCGGVVAGVAGLGQRPGVVAGVAGLGHRLGAATPGCSSLHSPPQRAEVCRGGCITIRALVKSSADFFSSFSLSSI